MDGSESGNASRRATGMLGAWHLDDDCIALSATRANGGESNAAATTPELVDQAQQDARTARRQWVPKRDCPAIDVDDVLRSAQPARRDEGDIREGFVDLDQIDV